MTPLTTKEIVELIISNNCFNCEQFWAPLATSECLCMPIEEMMSEQDEIEEWERQQKELTGEIEADDKQQVRKILRGGDHDCESDRLINSYDFEIGDVRKEGEE